MTDVCEWCEQTSSMIDSVEFQLEEKDEEVKRLKEINKKLMEAIGNDN